MQKTGYLPKLFLTLGACAVLAAACSKTQDENTVNLRFMAAEQTEAWYALAVGITQAISFDAESQTFVGAHDPRVPGKAAGQ